MSHNLLFFCLCKTSKKQHFRVFCRFFLVKLSKSRSLVEYLENSLADFNDYGFILQDFGRLSDEINLFWRCSSPLTSAQPCADAGALHHALWFYTFIRVASFALCGSETRCLFMQAKNFVKSSNKFNQDTLIIFWFNAFIRVSPETQQQ